MRRRGRCDGGNRRNSINCQTEVCAPAATRAGPCTGIGAKSSIFQHARAILLSLSTNPHASADPQEVRLARVTVEDCLERVDNRFALVILAARRAQQLAK